MLLLCKRFACLAIFVCAVVPTGCNTSPQKQEAAALKRGMALLVDQDYSRALLEFRNAARAAPKDAQPHYQMGLAQLAAANIRGAATAFRRAIELNPKHVGSQLKLAEMMAASRSGNLLEEASNRLESILATERDNTAPDNTEANDTLAIAEWKLGRTEDAAGRLEATLRKFPAHLQSSVALAKMMLNMDDLAGAEGVLKMAVASAPQSPDAAVALGQLYWLSKQPEKAEAEINRALQLDARSSSALVTFAALQVSGRRMDEAEQAYRRLSALPEKEFKSLHALFLFRTGKRDLALAEFSKLAGEEPGDRSRRSQLLAAYVALGKVTEARNLLTSALKSNPKDTDALFQRAELDLRQGESQKAENDIKEVVHFRPDYARAHFALAEVSRNRGSMQLERQELHEALRLDPGMISARLALSRNYRASNESKTALDVLAQTPQEQKNLLGVVTERNWALFALGRLKEMRSDLDRALQAGRYPEFLIQEAALKMRQGDYAAARASAGEALRRNPEDVRAARIVADSYGAQGQPWKGVESVAGLVQGHSQSARLNHLLGQRYLSAGKPAEARKAFEAAKSADPLFLDADLVLASMDRRENRPDAARRRLVAVLAADSKNVPGRMMLAGIEDEAGNRAEAIARYRAVLDIDGRNLFALNNLAYALAPDHPDEALKYARQAGEIAPDDVAVADTLGWIYYRNGLYPSAVGYLKRAVAKESTARRQFHLAMSYMKSGDRDLGQKALQAALRKDPNLIKTEKGW